jgi:hypothetical protein
MRSLDLDFARTPGADPVLAAALLAAGALALGAALWHTLGTRAEVARLTASVAEARQAHSGARAALRPAAEGADEATHAELQRAQQVVAALGMGWGALFRQLETQRVAGVTLLAVQREAGNTKRLRLSGEARRLEEALAYVAQVAQAPGFANVHLVAHEAMDEGERPAVRFALVADWVGQP